MRIDFTKSFFVEPQVSRARRVHSSAAEASLQGLDRASAWSPRLLRFWLLLGCAASVAVAAIVGEPSSLLKADPELATLLRGMAVLKALMVSAGLGLLCWRFAHPATPRTAALYVVTAWLVTGATVLIWQLTWLPLAALVFHVAGITALLVALADRNSEGPTATRQVQPDPR
ncbi:MAG: hypothetical protein ABI564_10110 [Ideonella sp.]